MSGANFFLTAVNWSSRPGFVRCSGGTTALSMHVLAMMQQAKPVKLLIIELHKERQRKSIMSISRCRQSRPNQITLWEISCRPLDKLTV